MEDLVKKLEEQISFLQNEISQMSDELYSQQKEVSILKKQISNVENTTIEIYTILGQVMFTKENTFNQETIDVSSYKSGTYFIKISKGAFTTTKKFTVL